MRNQTAALIAYRAFSDVVGKAAFFAVTVLAARRLSQEGFGILSLGTTIGWLVAAAADFGTQAHLARAVAQRRADPPLLLDMWLRVRYLSSLLVFAVAAAAIWVVGAGTPFTAALLVLVALYLVSGLIEFVHHFYRGLFRSDLESTFTLWWRATMLGCAAAALAWRPDVTTLAWALLLPAVLTFAVSVRRARRLAHDGPRHDARAELIDVRTELRRDVFPIGLGILLSAAYFRIDVLLIELWSGITAVGLYHAVFRLVDALRLFPAAVLAVLLPSLYRATDARMLLRVATGLTAFSAATALVLWVFAGTLVPFVYGPAYADAVPAFRVLLVAFPLMSLNYALTQQLIGWNGHRAYAVVCASALALNLALNARLIPAFSIVGAAWATVWTEVLVTVGCGAALWMDRLRNRSGEVRMRAAS